MCVFVILISIVSIKICKLFIIIFTQSFIVLIPIKIALSLGRNLGDKVKNTAELWQRLFIFMLKLYK